MNLYDRLLLTTFLLLAKASLAGDFTTLCADRTAIERVYYNHRLGQKPPFEQAISAELIQRLVAQDQHKEKVLKSAYGIELKNAELEVELHRINSTTRAPEVLAELKAALNNDPARFAQTVVKPILVERQLRQHFENDDRLNAPARRQAEAIRNDLLAAKTRGESATNLLAELPSGHAPQVSEMTWQLGPRPAEQATAADAKFAVAKRRFGPATEFASASHAGVVPGKLYFEDLPSVLRTVLKAQLRRAGDVSAVLEMPQLFAVYVVRDQTPEALHVTLLSIPKLDYERWLKEQSP